MPLKILFLCETRVEMKDRQEQQKQKQKQEGRMKLWGDFSGLRDDVLQI
jgi:hypothetical protein